MVLKFLGSATELFVAGKSELVLSASAIESELNSVLPFTYQNGLKIKSVNLTFLEGDQGVVVAVRGVVNVPTNPVSVTCGFGIAVRGKLHYDQATNGVFFDPQEFGRVSVLPGEDMPVVEAVVSAAFGVIGSAARGVGKGAEVAVDVASAGAGLLGRGAGFLTKRLPKFLKRGAVTAGATVSSAVGAVVGGIGGGLSAIERAVSTMAISAAQTLFMYKPVYTLKDDEIGRHAKQLVDSVLIENGMLCIKLSSVRHGTLTRWRYVVGGVVIVVLLGVGASYWW
jgi:hypothetical protein